MIILGIESSCDETAAALVENGTTVLSNIVSSQVKTHAQFQGVVPELASRMHLESINLVIDQAITAANLDYKDINAVAVVNTPGLIGSLLVGVTTAQVFAFHYAIPLIKVNHLHAHLYSPHIEHELAFPNIGLVASGGHTALYYSRSFVDHELIGSTLDDAVGECYDKVAKHFGLGYPGGPIIDRLAQQGNPYRYKFPKALCKGSQYKYPCSYSGLKTAVIHQHEQFLNKDFAHEEYSLPDLLASFQKTAIAILLDMIQSACDEYHLDQACVGGGVASNSFLRKECELLPLRIVFPSLHLSTDNAAMTAGFAYHLLSK